LNIPAPEEIVTLFDLTVVLNDLNEKLSKIIGEVENLKIDEVIDKKRAAAYFYNVKTKLRWILYPQIRLNFACTDWSSSP
jgi:adenine-specific DNA methylase